MTQLWKYVPLNIVRKISGIGLQPLVLKSQAGSLCHIQERTIIFRTMLTLLTLSFAITLGHRGNAEDEVTPTLLAPNGIVRLLDGSLLISDIESHRILQLDASGRLTFWGGTGHASFSGDGELVSQAAFNAPNDLKLDVANNAVLVADSNNHRIRKVDLRTLTIKTVAGNGSSELSGDHGPAIQAGLNNPQGIAVDPLGNLLVADTYNHVVRRIGIDGIITTIGGSTAGLSGDGGPATSAQISLPTAVAFGCDNKSFYISDSGNSRIRHVSSDGIIETVCGIGKGSDDAGAGFSGDGDLATKAKILSALDLAVVSPNFFYFSDSGNHRIRSVVHGIVFSVAGSGHPSAAVKIPINIDRGESIPTLFVPAKVAIAPDGGLYVCDRGNRTIRLLTKDGRMETLSIRADSTAVPSELESRKPEKEESK